MTLNANLAVFEEKSFDHINEAQSPKMDIARQALTNRSSEKTRSDTMVTILSLSPIVMYLPTKSALKESVRRDNSRIAGSRQDSVDISRSKCAW